MKKAQAKVVKGAKNKSWVPRTPPPPVGHLSVKAHKRQKSKKQISYMPCHYHRIYRADAVGLSIANYPDIIIHNSVFVCLSGLLLGNDKVQTRWMVGAWSNLDFLSNFLEELLLLEFAERVS